MADLTRLEQFLNHIAHPEDPIPAPLTRMEQNLLEIAENKDEAALPDYSEASDGDVLSIEDGAPAWKEPSGGGGVTTLYFDHDSMYETSDFWTDPTMSDPSAIVSFADALAMVQANPASALFQSNASGAMPAHAWTDGYGIYITMLAAPTQSGMMVYGYRFEADPGYNVETSVFLRDGS